MEFIYRIIRKIINKIRYSINMTGSFKFEDRSNNYKRMCYILAGYKEELWDVVFDRIYRFAPENIDICIVSSGLKNEKLKSISENNGWSYLYTKRNNLCLAQNLVIKAHPQAKYIFKLDEDMFITKLFFDLMEKTYLHVKSEGKYDPGFVAPLITINGFTYSRILSIFNKEKLFIEKFGNIQITGGGDSPDNFTKNPEIPLFLWSKIEEIKEFDKTNSVLNKRKIQYSVCPLRFSIGSIMFKRSLWENMGFFDVRRGNGMAQDEIKICNYCNTESLAVIISENSIVGHLAYGPQMSKMLSYYKKNINQFKLD